MICGMADVFQGILQRGRIDVGFLGGAQIDRFGNINTTVIGDYAHPAVRLPGSGGAAEIATHARRTLVIATLDRRAFPERVDFVTSPGTRRPDGGDRTGRGPAAVITDRGVFAPSPETGALELTALAPDARIEDVRSAVGWDLRVREPLGRMAAPGPVALRVLRGLSRTQTASAAPA
jgi:glutaconate CoA-transferase subunit B